MPKKSLLILLILFFISLNLFSKDEELDFYEVNENFYGLNNNGSKFDDEITSFQNDYYATFFEIIKENKNVKDTYNLDKLYKFVNRINDDSLIGIIARDSFLLYLRLHLNKPIIQLLNKYLDDNKDAKNIDSINYIISKKEKDIDKEYLIAQKNFNFSTVISRKELDNNISLILPSTEWKKMKLSTSSTSYYQAGDDNYSGLVMIHIKRINKKYNIFEDNKINGNIFNFKGKPITLKENMYFIKGGKIKEIASDIQIGKIKFRKVYEQITCSSQKYNYQVYAERKRFYITNNKIYIISLSGYLNGKHIFADREKLIYQKGLLLDSIIFN